MGPSGETDFTGCDTESVTKFTTVAYGMFKYSLGLYYTSNLPEEGKSGLASKRIWVQSCKLITLNKGVPTTSFFLNLF